MGINLKDCVAKQDPIAIVVAIAEQREEHSVHQRIKTDILFFCIWYLFIYFSHLFEINIFKLPLCPLSRCDCAFVAIVLIVKLSK